MLTALLILLAVAALAYLVILARMALAPGGLRPSGAAIAVGAVATPPTLWASAPSPPPWPG